MTDNKSGGFDWIMALIIALGALDHQSHKEALEHQRAEIKPFWWEKK